MKAQIDLHAKPGDEQVAARLKTAFFLDQHSDPAHLKDKSMAELRVRGDASERQLHPEDKYIVYNIYPSPRALSASRC
jgi:hypothetical protein